jgi:hypothetical protein
MPRPLNRLLLLVLLAGLPPAIWAQAIIVSYTFEDTTTAVVGSNRSTVTWNSGAAAGYTSPFTSQGRALSVSGFQIGEYYQITLDATGYRDVTLNSFRSNGSSVAPKDWKISYSLGGASGDFVDATTYLLASNTAANTTTISGFLLPTGADNNASLVLRLTATSSTRIDGNLGLADGTVRLDNLSFTATAIPEPSAYAAFAGLMAVACHFWRRRRQQS